MGIISISSSIFLRLCSYRFMDMFPDTALVRDTQRELDDIIQQGVQNITSLIRATDPNITDPLQTQGSKRSITAADIRSASSGQRGHRSPGDTKRSSLTGRLVREGLLTPDMLQQLQREWLEDHQRAADTQHHNNSNKGTRKKKK